MLSKDCSWINSFIGSSRISWRECYHTSICSKNFATKRYGGENETQAVTSFIADLQESAPGMNNEMEQTNVPPDTQMANSEESMMQSEIDEIDSGMMEA